MSVLYDLWAGSIIPSEHRFPDTKESKRLLDAIITKSEKLQTMLNDEGKDILDSLLDDTRALNSFRETQVFSYGFRYGAKLMMEVLQNPDQEEIEQE